LLDDLEGLVEKNKALLSRAIRQADVHLVAPSSWMLERVNKATSVGKNNVSLIPYGVDASHFKLGEKLKARRQLGLDPEAMYILLAAHHAREHRKGFDQAALILEELKSNYLLAPMITDGTLRVLLCGHDSGDVELPGYRMDRTGYLDFQTMPLLYQSADLLLFTSLEDNMPNVVMEALSCGLPVIGHDLGGVRDLIGNHGSDSESGWLFPIGETGLACSIIKKLLPDESSRRLIGAGGRKKRGD
jgi:glycosyltransferase involved in cell wall biosynthesis